MAEVFETLAVSGAATPSCPSAGPHDFRADKLQHVRMTGGYTY
jgi:hypothetical protein